MVALVISPVTRPALNFAYTIEEPYVHRMMINCGYEKKTDLFLHGTDNESESSARDITVGKHRARNRTLGCVNICI